MGQYWKPYIRFVDGTEETYCSQNAIYMTKHGLKDDSELTKISKSWDLNDHDSYGSCFSGLKLMEHSWFDVPFIDGIIERIEKQPANVAWVGDYADEFIGTIMGFTEQVFRKVWSDGDERLLELPFPALPKAHKDGYLVNITKLIFLDLGKYYTMNVAESESYSEPWCVHPLPLLTAIGNGSGGGDYFSEVGKENIGSWAMDMIVYTKEVPTFMNLLLNEVEYRFDSNA